MKQVSDSYKQTMDMIIRPTTQFRATLNMSDSSIPKESEVTESMVAFATGIFDTTHECDYITLEEDYWQVGSGQLIPPASNPLANGYVSTVIAGASGIFTNPPVITIEFGVQKRFSTIVYNFISAYPTAFTITTYLNDNLVEQREIQPDGLTYNDVHNYSYCDTVVLTFNSLSVGSQRLRIASIIFGAIKTFTTSDLISMTQDLEIDPLSSVLPINELTMRLNNIDKSFDPDNPTSDWEYFENGQPLSIEYGIYVNNETELEWITGATLLLSDTPTVDKSSVTFKASDQLSFMTDTFYGGTYEPNGVSMYDLAEQVFADAGITRYVISNELHDIYTVAPLPAIPQRECLQLIANASCAVLYTDPNGVIHIEREDIFASKVSTYDETAYSNAQSIIAGAENISYITLEKNRWRVGDNRMLIAGEPYRRVGYVSDKLTGNNGTFTTPYPTITIQYDQPVPAHDVKLRNDIIGGTYIYVTTVKWYLNGTQVYADDFEHSAAEYAVIDAPAVSTYDTVAISITAIGRMDGASGSNLRARITGLDDGLGNDYYIDFGVVYDPPTVRKTELLRLVSVAMYSYSEGTEAIQVYEEEITLNGEDTIYAIYPASTGLSVTSTGNISITSSQLNAAVGIIEITGTGTGKIIVTGTPLNIKESSILTRYSNGGEECPIANPLITSAEVAQKVGEWVTGYLSHRNTYEVNWREDFRLDANDKIFIKSNFAEHIPARVTKLQYNLPGCQGLIAVRGLN